MILNAFYFSCRRRRRLHQRYMKESIYFSYKMSKTSKMEGKPHSIHERRRRRRRLHQRYMKESIYFLYKMSKTSKMEGKPHTIHERR